jgi:hypothetical protein
MFDLSNRAAAIMIIIVLVQGTDEWYDVSATSSHDMSRLVGPVVVQPALGDDVLLGAAEVCAAAVGARPPGAASLMSLRCCIALYYCAPRGVLRHWECLNDGIRWRINSNQIKSNQNAGLLGGAGETERWAHVGPACV